MRVFSNGPSGRLGAAILPVPAPLAQAYQSWGPIVGMPGTTDIPAPYPAAVPQGVDRWTTDPLGMSSQAPPIWRPGIYYQPKPASRFGGATESDNQMPVPAVKPSAKIAQQLRNPVFLRQNQIGQPINLPKYAWRR
jgi:hypothetical protein